MSDVIVGVNIPTVTLRPETMADEPFLRRLTIAIRWQEFAPLPIDLARKTALLNQQHDAQHGHYLAFHPKAAFCIVEADGEPAGRLYIDRGKKEYLLIDIALLPDRCGLGIGGALIDDLLADAAAHRRIVALQVDPFNPARRLYLRKGFRDVSQQDFRCLMHWRPSDQRD